MATIISGHNSKILNPAPAEDPRTCNCRKPKTCPLSGKCLTECVVYKATVTAPPKLVRHYYGLTDGPFKTRYKSHTHSFRTKSYKKDTELSKYIWDLQDSNQHNKSNGTLYTMQHPTNKVHEDVTSASQRKW